MVKAADINKDIKSIAEKVGTAVFSYNEIHNKDVKNTFHYDYQKVIDEVSRLNGRDMTDELIEKEILRPLPNGEYKVNVGDATLGGGGLNYAGTAFFSFSSKDYQIKYHELAHSLQKHYDLFNDETVGKMYADAEEKLGGKEKAEGKLMEKCEYELYLNEMHSESFAYAALMLRAKNPADFMYQAVRTYSAGVARNIVSLYDFRKPRYGGGNANTKFYTSYSVMKETIKQVWKIRRAQKQGEFFDENGVLKDEKLARLSEQTVIKSAYTPRTLNTLFKNKFFSKTSLHENGWRRDMVKSVLAQPLVMTSAMELMEKIKHFKEHYLLVKKEKAALRRFINSSYRSTDKEAEALHKYSQIMFQASILFTKQDVSLIKSYMQGITQSGGLSEKMSKYVGQRAFTVLSEVGDFKNKGAVKPFLESFNKFVKENGDNPYFMALLRSDMPLDEAVKLKQQKKHNPDAQVLNLDELAKRVPQTGGFGFYPVVTELKKIAAFADKYDKTGNLKKRLEKMFIHHPEMLENNDVREGVLRDFAPKKGKKAFAAEMEECLNSAAFCHLSDKSNPKYAAALNYLAQNGGDNMLAAAQQQLIAEREAGKRKIVQEQGNSFRQYETVADKAAAGLPEGQAEQTQNISPEKSPKEKVIEKLKSWGIEDGSYMMLTPEENAKTGHPDGFRSTECYFSEGKKDIAVTGKEVVYGTNNGLIGAYFAEGVYVVSSSAELRNALYYKGVDNGFGVMLSNGEKFDNPVLNERWSRIEAKGHKINEEMQKEYLLRQQRLSEAQKLTAGNTVYQTMQNIVQIADKHDKSGQLKDDLLNSYTRHAEQMLTLEYWGNVVQRHADTSPEGREACVKELGSLGLALGKEIKSNAQNNFYKDIKKNCAAGKNGDEILKISQKYASHSTEAGFNNTSSVRIAACR